MGLAHVAPRLMAAHVISFLLESLTMKMSNLLAMAAMIAAVPAAAQIRSHKDEPSEEQQAQPQQEEGGIRPSKGALKQIVALQQAYQSKDAAAIAGALAAAKSAASTKEDQYLIGKIQLNAAIEANDSALTEVAIETMGRSGILPAPKVAELYVAHGNAFSRRQQHAEAAAAFERGLALDPGNFALLGNLAEAKYSQGRPAEAVPYLQRLIAATAATGAKPAENVYKRAFVVANEAKVPAVVEIGRAWVSAYPNPESWRNAIAIYQNVNKPDVTATLDLLRLLRAVGALSSVTHYSLYSTAAADRALYGEAHAVIDEGLAKNVITPSTPVINDVIAGLKTKPRGNVEDLAVGAQNAKNGTALLRVGDRYYGIGEYAKAAEIYRQLKGKSDVDQGLVDLHLGMALARGGDKAGAAAALGQVGGAHAGIAQYWLIFVNQMA